MIKKLCAILGIIALTMAARADGTSDALLDKLVQKGILTTDEADALRSQTNNFGSQGTQFKFSKAFKSVEIFGDLRFRYEYRSAEAAVGTTPFPAGAAGIPGFSNLGSGGTASTAGAHDVADRWRYALRLGVRGDLDDDFYYGLRFETAPNPRSPWNTFGGSTGGNAPYQGPFSKANNFGVFVGQAYLGYRPFRWLDVSVGRFPQALYTTPMVWDSDFCQEGAVEKLAYKAGPVDLFATFGQFVYQDVTPASGEQVIGIVGNGNSGIGDNAPWMLAWQAGAKYQINRDMSFKVAPVVYNYTSRGNAASGFAGPFVGQGTQYGTTFVSLTTTSSTLPGTSGIPAPITPNVNQSTLANGYNQTGVNDLLILEVPAELDFKLGSLGARLFGDFAVNFEGDQRARAAAAAGKADAATDEINPVSGTLPAAQPNPFPNGPVLGQDKAMQVGLAVGSDLDETYGQSVRKHAWEARVYWQRVQQYALDPNLLDSDFFEGRGNMEGIYAALAYGFSDAVIGTIRYGRANIINKNLGTGGFNADLPLLNPIEKYDLVQVDLTLKF